MSTANDRQPGGDHYKKREYQHWDFVCDSGLHYLPANASKYLSRWRDKNGLEDLEKSIHYLEKTQERGIPACVTTDTPRVVEAERVAALQRFVGSLPEYEAEAVVAMFYGEYEKARTHVRALIDEVVAAQREAAKNTPPLFGRGGIA